MPKSDAKKILPGDLVAWEELENQTVAVVYRGRRRVLALVGSDAFVRGWIAFLSDDLKPALKRTGGALPPVAVLKEQCKVCVANSAIHGPLVQKKPIETDVHGLCYVNKARPSGTFPVLSLAPSAKCPGVNS